MFWGWGLGYAIKARSYAVIVYMVGTAICGVCATQGALITQAHDTHGTAIHGRTLYHVGRHAITGTIHSMCTTQACATAARMRDANINRRRVYA